jgi:drug/metabolite transporter (DMT)-like permease
MLVMLLGALLVVAGVVLMAAPPIWRGRLSGRRTSAPRAGDTLEPREPGAGFELKQEWPGLAMVLLGVVLLVVGAVV